MGARRRETTKHMKAKEWLTQNVNFRRKDTEIRENKGYFATMAACGFIVGIITGIIVIILQFAVSNPESQQTWMNIISSIAIILMVGFLLYMLTPFFKASNITLGNKILTTLISIACLAIPFIIGIYAVMLLFMLVAALAALWLALKIWGSSSSSSSSSYSAPKENHGPEKYKLDDGTTVTENSFGGGFHGDDYHNYERNIDGTFTRTD